MPALRLSLAGDAEAAEALHAALQGAGFDAHFHAASGVGEALTGTEQKLERRAPDAAVAVGTGAEALAFAITAAKQGVPLAAYRAGSGPNGDEMRVLATLAGADLGADPARAPDLIAAWLAEAGQRET